MTGIAYNVEGRAVWDNVMARFGGSGLDDIYFDHRYASLYARQNKIPRAFVYEDGEALFFLPMIISPIEGGGNVQWYDFETVYGYSGPICRAGDVEFLTAAWQAFDAYCRSNRIVAGLFRFNPLIENHALAEAYPGVEVMLDRQTVYLDLDKEYRTVWDEYASDNRNRIRKAEKLGITLETKNDLSALRTFSDLYHGRMEELEADENYFFGAEYFEKIMDLGTERFRVLLAKAGGEVVGGAILLLSARFVHYHLSSTPRRYQKYAANNFLRDAAIKTFLGQGREKILFGGGRTAAADDSLLRFKERFSKTHLPFYIGRYVGDAAAYDGIRQEWKRNHPEMVAAYGNRVLCYRYV